VTPFTIVEQGPVYGGPQIVTTPKLFTTGARAIRHCGRLNYYPTYRNSYLLPPLHKPWRNARP
jgi:hypothetical protein